MPCRPDGLVVFSGRGAVRLQPAFSLLRACLTLLRILLSPNLLLLAWLTGAFEDPLSTPQASHDLNAPCSSIAETQGPNYSVDTRRVTMNDGLLRRQAFAPRCPAGGTWWSCGYGTYFVGCCARDPCQITCAQGNLYPGGFDANAYGTFPDATCGTGSKFYTCTAGATFWGKPAMDRIHTRESADEPPQAVARQMHVAKMAVQTVTWSLLL